jgi:hypothetical protein
MLGSRSIPGGTLGWPPHGSNRTFDELLLSRTANEVFSHRLHAARREGTPDRVPHVSDRRTRSQGLGRQMGAAHWPTTAGCTSALPTRNIALLFKVRKSRNWSRCDGPTIYHLQAEESVIWLRGLPTSLGLLRMLPYVRPMIPLQTLRLYL